MLGHKEWGYATKAGCDGVELHLLDHFAVAAVEIVRSEQAKGGGLYIEKNGEREACTTRAYIL